MISALPPTGTVNRYGRLGLSLVMSFSASKYKSSRRYYLKKGVCTRHYTTQLIKQVFPRLARPIILGLYLSRFILLLVLCGDIKL